MKVSPLVKLCVLAAVGCGLYALWQKGVPRREEKSETMGETEVAVHVGKISLSTLRHGVTAYGTVEPEPAVEGKAPASAQIRSPVSAIVGEVNCVEGQQVEKGQTLFTLTDIRKPDGSVEHSLLKITAPLSGKVTYVNVRPGEVTDPEAPAALVELVDLSRLIVAANVPSSQLNAVTPGQTAEITTSKDEAHESFATTETPVPNPVPVALTGTVTFIEDRVDPKTDMGAVDISVPAEARLRPGQFVRVRIITEERRDCLTVPSRSIVKSQSGEWVIYLVSGKQAIQQPVRVGFREGDMVQVHSLILQPGDKVVTTGAYGLPAKTRISVISD